jgi:hypothetical protein
VSASAAASASASADAGASAAATNDLTPERRGKLEAAIAEAKGFVDAKEIGAAMVDDVAFNKTFADALTKKSADGWILFRGTMNDLQKDTFALAMMIAEVDPNSPIGAPKVVIFHAKDVKGYDASKYQAGDYGAILAKFAGGAKLEIKPGFDVKGMGSW